MKRRREHGHGFYDVEAGTAQELMNDRLGEARGVVLDTDRLLGFAELDATDSVDFANFGDGKGGSLGGGRSVAVQDIKLGHRTMIPAALLSVEYPFSVESRIWGYLWLKVRFPA
jgi:hypothetical protein